MVLDGKIQCRCANSCSCQVAHVRKSGCCALCCAVANAQFPVARQWKSGSATTKDPRVLSAVHVSAPAHFSIGAGFRSCSATMSAYEEQFPHAAICVLVVTTGILGWRLWSALPARVGGGFRAPQAVDQRHTMVVLGSGGHTGEMAALLADLTLPAGVLTLVVASTDTSSQARLKSSSVSAVPCFGTMAHHLCGSLAGMAKPGATPHKSGVGNHPSK